MENQEKKEINTLLNKGFQVAITAKTKKRKYLFWHKKEVFTKVLNFKEPTLAVLDLVTEQYLKLKITEPTEGSENSHFLLTAYKTTNDNALIMAKIISIFALGEECFIFNGYDYNIDNDEINALTNIVFHSLKPSEMQQIIQTITALANLPNFLISIRLTGAARTTTPAALVE